MTGSESTSGIPLLSPERLQRGYVLVLPGIEGYSWLNRRIVKGLASAGVPYGIEIHDWTKGWPSLLYNLRSKKLHAVEAERLAEKIIDYQRRWPQRPVYLIGHSGGGGLALQTLSSLPSGVSISGSVLLGAAVSSTFDYRPALQHVQRKVWNFSSLGDVICLGLFMACAGTMDGCHGCGAGMVGFRPRGLTVDERARFQEMPFRTGYFIDGHYSGHFGFTAPRFIRNHVAPLIMTCEIRAEEPVSARAGLPVRVADAPV